MKRLAVPLSWVIGGKRGLSRRRVLCRPRLALRGLRSEPPGLKAKDLEVKPNFSAHAWGIYTVVASVGFYLLSDVYRVWGIRKRIDHFKDDQQSALEERIKFVKSSDGHKEDICRTTVNPAAATETDKEKFDASFTGTYSDLPGRSRFFLSKGDMTYKLSFFPESNSTTSFTFEGEGEDAEGKFEILGGRYDKATGRLAWGERSKAAEFTYIPFGRVKFTLYAECRAEVTNASAIENNMRLKGWYEANTGRSGELRLHVKGADYSLR